MKEDIIFMFKEMMRNCHNQNIIHALEIENN